MNSNYDPEPAERVGLEKHISKLWSSKNRIATLIVLVTTSVALNCCCLIIPLWDYSGGP